MLRNSLAGRPAGCTAHQQARHGNLMRPYQHLHLSASCRLLPARCTSVVAAASRPQQASSLSTSIKRGKAGDQPGQAGQAAASSPALADAPQAASGSAQPAGAAGPNQDSSSTQVAAAEVQPCRRRRKPLAIADQEPHDASDSGNSKAAVVAAVVLQGKQPSALASAAAGVGSGSRRRRQRRRLRINRNTSHPWPQAGSPVLQHVLLRAARQYKRVQAALPSMQQCQYAAGAAGTPSDAIAAAGEVAAADKLVVSGLPRLVRGRQVPEARRPARQQKVAAVLAVTDKGSKRTKLLMQNRSKQIDKPKNMDAYWHGQLRKQLAGALLWHQLCQLLHRRSRLQQRTSLTQQQQRHAPRSRKHLSLSMLRGAAYVPQAAAQQEREPQSSKGGADMDAGLSNMFPLPQFDPEPDIPHERTASQQLGKASAQATAPSRVSLRTPTVSHYGFVSFLARAASPGVLLQVLQYHVDELSASQYSTAYARLAELCRENPHFLPHPETQHLLELLKCELPRMQHHVLPWHLALMSAGSIHLQQPELLRVMLPRLLQDPQLQPAQLVSSIVACFRMQQQPLGRALVQLLLQDEQLFACDSRGELASLAAIKTAPALQLQEPEQQLLLDTLLIAADTSSVQQVAAAIWLAAGAIPDQRQQWEHLLDTFMQLLPQAKTATVAAVLGSATAIRWELPAEQLEQLLAVAEQQVPTASAVDSRLTYEAAVHHRVSRKAPLQHNYSQLYTLLMAFHRQLPSAQARDVYGVLSAAAVAGATMPVAMLQDLIIRFTELLPEATHWQITGVLWSVATLRTGTGGKMAYRVHAAQLTQLVAAFLQRVPEADAARSVSKVMWAVATMGMGHELTNQQLQHCDELWAQHWGSAEDAELPGFCRAVFAFGQLQYLPERLLAAVNKNMKLLHERAARATAAQLSALVMAFAKWGYSCAARKAWHDVALQRLQRQGAEAFGGQAAANLAWASAVLSISGRSVAVRPAGRDKSGVMMFAAACREVWSSLGVQEKLQLRQAHLWLRDLNGDEAVQGLKGVVSRRQLDECAALWHVDLKTEAPAISRLQLQVFDLLQQLPASTWQQVPALEQQTGGFSTLGHFIDIAAVRADSKRLAIEVDGPMHFIRPSNRVDGPTRCRNLLLEAQGWTVVSIPYYEFQALSADQPGFSLRSGAQSEFDPEADALAQQLEYLLKKVQEA